MSFLRVLLVGLVFMGCKDDTGISVGDNEILVQYEQSRSKEIDGKEWSVEFVGIEENSLCLPDVNCVWLGRLVVSLKINGEATILGFGDLETNAEEDFQNQVEMDGVTITFSEALNYDEESTTKIILVFE
ncbi:hypothetical protein [Ekhidna sp.]|uniref:hypothetical protein n=1 Tax=Ekhidna sp. TaxID=2608089 RepID=UPI003517A7A7